MYFGQSILNTLTIKYFWNTILNTFLRQYFEKYFKYTVQSILPITALNYIVLFADNDILKLSSTAFYASLDNTKPCAECRIIH